MKIIFFGSSDFALPILETLVLHKYNVVCVVTQPDRYAGRGLKLKITPIKQYSIARNIAVFQPDNLNSEEAYNHLKSFAADLFVVVSYGRLIPKKILQIPRIFSVNVHASLLPKYRGAAPINWAIIKGEEKSGISIIKMNEFIDSGPVILQRSMAIDDNDDACSLSNKLARLAGELIIQALDLIKNKTYTLTEQDEKSASYAPKLSKKDGKICWSKNRKDIFNRIRGLIPWPGSYTYLKGKILKIWKARSLNTEDYKLNAEAKPGEILGINPEEIIVFCSDGALALKEVQIEAGRRMSVRDFISGHKIKKGDFLG